jgi:hypothetical protein
MTLVENDLTALAIATIATRLAKMMYVLFYFGPDQTTNVGIKLIKVYDSDPDFVEYAKPKARVKVGVLYSVNIYKGADT